MGGTVAAEPPGAPTGLARIGAHTFLFSALTLVVNLASGVIIARGMGADGRGELTAVLTIAVVGVWIFGMGSIPAASYHGARHPDDAGRLLATWLALMVPIGAVGIGVFALLCPVLLAAQEPGTVGLARLFMLSMLPSLMLQAASGVLLGVHDFLFVNVASFLRFVAIVGAYVALLVGGVLVVWSALLVNAVVDAAFAAIYVRRVVARYGWARPDLALGRRTLWYGFRAHGTQVGGIVNGRVDLLLLPAFLTAVSVGLYAVATSVSGIVFALANALALVVLPAAARDGGRRTEIVMRATYATLVIGVVLGAVVAAVATPAVRIVYGAEFLGSAEAIRLLLPGTVALAMAGVLGSGLYALERPGLAAVAQVPGIVVTVVGLLLFLRAGGIVAAAIVSSVAYATVLATSLWLYRRAAGVPWRALWVRPFTVADLRRLAPVMRGRHRRAGS